MGNKLSELSKPVAWKIHGHDYYYLEMREEEVFAAARIGRKSESVYSQEYVSALLDVAVALREWIDAVPDEIAASLPTMPGIDRDWVDSVIGKGNRNG